MSQEDFDRDHRRTLRQGRDELVRAFSSDRNVTAVGLGYRSRGGERTDEPVVIAAVAKKRPEAHVARTRMLPSQVDIDGRRYGVDVIQAGPFRAGPAASAIEGEPMVRDEANVAWEPIMPLVSKFRPALQGCMISNEANVSAGSFGCLVRDRTDGTLCLLSSNLVLANINRLYDRGSRILQPRTIVPDFGNVIANLKRYIPLGFTQATAGNVDCAIAQVSGQVSKNVALEMMPPISQAHPAVGLVSVCDTSANLLIGDMGEVLRQLNVELLPDNAVRRAELGMRVNKVGAGTRYTASQIVGLDFTASVFHGFPGVPDPFWLTGVHLVGWAGWLGDLGAVVCMGGENDRPVYVLSGGCFVIPIIPDMYDLPATATTEFADRIRDEFLALTLVGRLLIQVLYLNSDTVVSRTEGIEASDDEKLYANDLYAKYRDFMEAALDDPDNPDYVVTQEHLDDTSFALYGFSMRATPEETEAASQLYERVLTRTLGMNYRQLLAFMNDVSVYTEVYDILATVPGIVMRAPTTTS